MENEEKRKKADMVMVDEEGRVGKMMMGKCPNCTMISQVIVIIIFKC